MTFATVYPHYVEKVERKGRTINELHQVITWLTGFNEQDIQHLIAEQVSFQTFFDRANLNPNAYLIKGKICGQPVENIKNPLTQKVRFLDKLVDELAKGKKLEQIFRKS